MLNKDTIFRLFVALVAGICGYLFFGTWYPWHFAVREQAQLLMLTPGTILSYMQEPAWLACYLGDYLTQFFFHPHLGIGLLVVVLLLTWWVGARLLRRVVDYAHIELYALFPLAAEMVMLGRIDYPLSMPFVLLLSLLFAGICLRIRQSVVSAVVGVLVLPLVYGLAGYGVYLFLLTVIAVELARGELRLSYWLVLAAEAVVVPLSLGDYFQLEGREVFCYPAVERVWLFPALTWLVVIVMLALVPRRRFYMNWREQAAVWSLSFLLLVGGLAITTDFHREKMLAIGAAYDRGEWGRVVRLTEELEEPDFVATYYRNLALFRDGQLPERLFDYPQPYGGRALLLPMDALDFPDTFAPCEAYFALGDWNMARYTARRAIEVCPKSQSIRGVKRLAEIYQEAGDSLAMHKYLTILERTWFYADWARKQEVKRDTTEVADVPLGLRDPSDARETLFCLAELQPKRREVIDYVLCYCLLERDLASFVEAYRRWGTAHYSEPPRIYAEALLLQMPPESGRRKQRRRVEKLPFGITETQMKAFQDYRTAARLAGHRREALEAAYGTTYWFYDEFRDEK